MGLACWELQGIKILILFYLVYLSVVRQHATPEGMKAANNPSTYYCWDPSWLILPLKSTSKLEVLWTQLDFCHTHNLRYLSSKKHLAFWLIFRFISSCQY